ncbi:MAG: type IV pilin protein [Legionellales bacterium]|nr:type IV pilin protein [Legionellales bacterium]
MKEGYSLMELIAVLAIISILSLISYPSYQQFLIRAHRNEGHIALLDLANRMEWHYTQHQSYQTATIAQHQPTDVLCVDQSTNGWYTLSITESSNTGYTLKATPRGAQAIGDKQCQSLTHNSQGVRGIANGPMGVPLGNAADCW